MTASQQGGGSGSLAAAAARSNLLRDSVQMRAAALVAQRWTARKGDDAHSDGGASPADELHLQARQQQQRRRQQQQQRLDDLYSSDDCDDDDRSSQRRPRRSRKKAPRGLDYSRWARRAESRVFLPIVSGSASSSVDDLRAIGAAAGSEVRGRSSDGGESPPTAVAMAEAPARGGKKRTSDAAAVAAASAKSAAASASGVPQPLAPPPADNDEELGEEERVELAIKAVKRLEGGLLREIHEIKERHKTLEALTVTRARAAKNEAGAASAVATPATAATAKKATAAPPSRHRREPPLPPQQQQHKQRQLLPMTPRPASSRRDQHQQQQYQQPHSGSEPNGGPALPVDGSSSPVATADASWPEKAIFLRAPGVAWKIRSLSPGGGRQPPRGSTRSRAVPPPTLHPSASARLGMRQLRQWSDLDLGSAYFLPPSVSEAKTPIEAALRLHKVLTDLSLLNPARSTSQRAAGVAVSSRM